MKELSIKEKAKAYDEIIEKANKMHSENCEACQICIEELVPELKDSEDERIRKELLDFCKNRAEYYPNNPKYKNISAWIAWLEKQGEQKPVDKVEPKFHEGDFILNGDVTDDGKPEIFRVLKVCDTWYDVENIYDSRHTIITFKQEYSCRVWNTIQDAKDGDVLAIDPWSDYPSSFVTIYKKQNDEDFDSYCFVGFDGKFYKGENGHSTENIHPATKEQRELLFQKMKEAGYAFDFEKKELKEVEENPAWSKEDENLFNRCVINIQMVDSDDTLKIWLEFLKDRVQPKQE